MLIDHDTVNVINPATGQHLGSHTIDPDHNYWRNNKKAPGRWPGPTPSWITRLISQRSRDSRHEWS